jgi:speckle-type POZ protein
MLLHQKTVFIDYGSAETVEKSIVNRLTEMFLAQKLCDVQLNFEEETSVGAHTLILASGSPVFSATFECGLSESQSRTVSIDDIDREVFCQLLIYLNTGSNPKLKAESITQSLFVASDKYDVESLENECVEETTEHQ